MIMHYQIMNKLHFDEVIDIYDLIELIPYYEDYFNKGEGYYYICICAYDSTGKRIKEKLICQKNKSVLKRVLKNMIKREKEMEVKE